VGEGNGHAAADSFCRVPLAAWPLTVFKTVGTSGQITLGKRYAGRHFEVEERLNGEILLRPVKIVRETAANRATSTLPEFGIVEIDRVIMPSRDERNARD